MELLCVVNGLQLYADNFGDLDFMQNFAPTHFANSLFFLN